MKVITLLTDFGTADYFVGAVKGVLSRLAPACPLVDISHEIPPGDVAWGAHVLGAAAPEFAPGTLHLAVVDPGVGSGRRILVARSVDQLYIAPDNGLLTKILGRESAVWSVEREDLFLAGPSQTFHARDRFAPVAAFLARGGSPGDLGPPVADPFRLPIQEAERSGQTATGEVIHVDRFGNLVTNLPSHWLPERRKFRLILGETTVLETQAQCYTDLPVGLPGIVPGSLGTLEVSIAGDSAGRSLRITRGARVELRLLCS
jgi:S-adenosylmethionine hydrolase